MSVVWKLMAQAKGSTQLPTTFMRNANLLKGVASADLLERITVLLHVSHFADLALWESRRGKLGKTVQGGIESDPEILHLKPYRTTFLIWSSGN